jgi:hypothetical protein
MTMHIQKRHRKRLREEVHEELQDTDEYDDHPYREEREEEHMVEECEEEHVDVVCDTYFIYQTQIIKKVSVYSEDSVMPKVKKHDGSFGSTHRRVYMLILMYVASRPHISEDDATELITLIKEITKVHTEEIPLPSRYVHKYLIMTLFVT